jgi:hypothetical protein
MQLRFLFDLIADLLKYPSPRPGRIRHEMLQRLTVTILHAIRNPGKAPITFHRHLTLQTGQGMFARIPRLVLESLSKALPVL